ncbi:ABC transporter ATP-binding protein [[Bacillus] sp. KCTC 13219]|nr:ABC transporter ATP-binding protein [[Bacillus] sp. KCTC 13219]
MIRCENIVKKYRGKEVLKGVSCHLDEHKIIGLIGRNGAGKSTLLNILAGHIKPTAGKVSIYNSNPFNSITAATNTIFIEEGMTFAQNDNIAQILKTARRFYPNWQQELAEKLLQYVGIHLNSSHQNLSKGQRSTFNLIYGLATRCAITLLDEPMNGMDEAVRADMYRAILKEYIAYPRTIIISSHHLKEIEHLIEEILLIHNGQVVFHEELEKMQQYAVRLVGQPEQLEPYRNHALFVKQEGLLAEVVIERKYFDGQSTIQVQPVSVSDACRYMTASTTGGIDDVFQ